MSLVPSISFYSYWLDVKVHTSLWNSLWLWILKDKLLGVYFNKHNRKGNLMTNSYKKGCPGTYI